MVSLDTLLLKRVNAVPSQPSQRRYYKFFLDNEEKYGYNKITNQGVDMNQVEFKPNEETKNPELLKELEKDSPVKEWLVDYVGNKLGPETDEVTLAMIIEVMAEEFPEFLMALAEENWVRGYHQAINDMETGQKLYEEELQKKSTVNEQENTENN